jgi:hypothetical protein
MIAKIDPSRDWAIDWLVVIAPPCDGISYLTGVECPACVVRTYLPVQNCACPIVFIGHRGCRGHVSGAVIIESQGNGGPAQDGLFWSLPVAVLPVCVWIQLLLKWPLLVLLPPLKSRGAFCVAGVPPWPLRWFVGRCHTR